MGRSVLKQLRFALHFDDPRLPEEQRITIRGDRDQLESLQEAVTTYVQGLLNSSSDRFNAVFSKEVVPSDSVVSPTPQALDLKAEASSASEEPHSLDSDTAARTEVEEIAPKQSIPNRRGIFLQPGRGLSHDLFLGSLATEATGFVIHLSVLQLFDLATALDEYGADVIALPITPTRSDPIMPTWASIAAVLVLAVGLTTVVQLLNRSGSRQPPATTNAIPNGNSQSPIALQPPTPPLSSLQTLPPPPPVGSLASPNSISPISVPGTNPALPGAPRVNPPQATPVTPIPRQTTPQQIVIKPTPRQNTISIPESAKTSSARPQSTVRTSPTPAAPTVVLPSPNAQITTLSPELEAALSQGRGTSAAGANSNSISRASSNPAAELRSPSTPTPANKPTTAFDTIPQVAEARAYFNRRWQPPASLKETLEYSLILDVDGTIQRIEPLGQAARTYIDETGMPLISEPFVSPNKNGQTPRIRVVLSPNGKVQTFLEPD